MLLLQGNSNIMKNNLFRRSIKKKKLWIRKWTPKYPSKYSSFLTGTFPYRWYTNWKDQVIKNGLSMDYYPNHLM